MNIKINQNSSYELNEKRKVTKYTKLIKNSLI